MSSSSNNEGKRLLVPWYRYPPFRETGIGGLSVVVWELTRALAREGVKVDVITPGSADPKSPEVVDGVTVHRNGTGMKLARGERLDSHGASLLLSEYDSILSIANLAGTSLSMTPALRGITRRQIHTIGHDRPLSSYLSMKPSPTEYLRMYYHRRREKRLELALRGVLTLCVSAYLSRGMVRHGLEREENLRLIPNGVDTKTFRPLSGRRREEEDDDDDDHRHHHDLIFVGRSQRAKGLDKLLDALRLLRTRGLRPTLAVVGEFSEADRLFLKSGLPEDLRSRISFKGTVGRDSMPDVLNSSRILVVPSRYETFGMPALEAISCGLPVVASGVGGLPEIIDEGVGIIIPAPTTPPALADALASALRDDSLAQRALVNGPRRALGYDWSNVASRVADAILLG